MPKIRLSDIIINKKYRTTLRPLTKEEHDSLRESISAEGVRDPLVVCEGTMELVEGHHRYQIATELGIQPPIITREFEDEEAIMHFIWSNAMSRRNLTELEMAIVRGRLYESIKRKDGGHGQHANNGVNAAEQVAEMSGVSVPTVQRDGKLATALDNLAGQLRTAYQNGTLKMSREEVIALAQLAIADQVELARDVRVGTLSSWRVALKLDKPKPKKESKPKPAKEKSTPAVEAAKDTKEPTTKDRMASYNDEVELFARSVSEFAAKAHRIESKWFDDNRWGLITDALKSAAETIRQAKAKGLCPACSGASCKKCRGEGYVPRAIYETLGGK